MPTTQECPGYAPGTPAFSASKMPSALTISIGQYSDKGRKDTNQDFHGVMVPDVPQLSSKGIAIAVADDWGMMDGNCTDRILAEIDRLAR